MRLDFSILWFENQPSDVASQMDEIRESIIEHGFRPEFVIQENSKNIAEYAAMQQNFNKFELVIVDYDLGNPEDDQGDAVAKRIRQQFGFTDIMFYSGQAAVHLRKRVYERNIDGVYCMSRQQLVEAVTERIDELVQRMGRLEAMRGVAVGSVGLVDDCLRSIIEHIYQGLEEKDSEKMDKFLDERIDESAAMIARQRQEIIAFTDRIRSRLASSQVLSRVAIEILKYEEGLEDKRSVLKRFGPDVLEPRNKLGHVVETMGDEGPIIESAGSAPAIGSGQFPELRKKMIHHIDNVDQIRVHLGIEGDQ